MAIIEELSSDEEQPVQSHKPARATEPPTKFADLGVASSNNPVQALLVSKKALHEE